MAYTLTYELNSDGNSYTLSGYSGDKPTGDLVIPDSYNSKPVTIIGIYAFTGCSSLTSIIIPNSVTGIASYAFQGCKGLTSITIPNSVTGIGIYAFNGCGGLTSITIPDSVTSIGNFAFFSCARLTSVTIGNGVTSIGSSAFSSCTGLTSIEVADGNTKYHSNGNCLIKTETKTIIAGCKTSVIPADGSVTSIGEAAFSGCSGLASITIPDSVTSIATRAFDKCTGLTSITIPNGVTSIGSSAFSGCSSLESITIPFVGAQAGKTSSDTFQYPFGYIFGTSSYTGGTATKQTYYAASTSSTTYDIYYIPSSLKSVTVTGGNILRGAFSYCRGLTSVTIPNSITSIGDYAFEECSGLTSVIIPNSVTSIGLFAFSGCSSLMSLTIGSGVTSIGYCAFEGCTGLASIILPDSVTSIGGFAFGNCTALASITIPNNVTSIGNNAFDSCSSLTKINMLPVTPPVIQAYTLTDTIENIYVPSNSAESYKTATNWNTYADKITEFPLLDLGSLLLYNNKVKEKIEGVANITKESIGLGSVDNIADINQTVHGARQLTNEDLNTFNGADSVGWYYSGGGNAVVNKPSGVGVFALEVVRTASGSVVQKLTYTTNLYQRVYDGSTWSTWVEFAKTNGTYSDLTAGKANELAYVLVGSTASPNSNWYEIATVPVNTTTYDSFSIILLLNGRKIHTQMSGIIELEGRCEPNNWTYKSFKILCGNLISDHIAYYEDTDKTIHFYLYAPTTTYAISTLSSYKGKLNITNPLTLYQPQELPEGLIYGANYNFAAYDAESNKISDTYAKQNGTYANLTAGKANVHTTELLASDADLNTYYGASHWGKHYYATGSNTISNRPIANINAGFALEVLRGAGSVTIQRCTLYTKGNSANTPVTFTRAHIESSWMAWEEVAEANGTYPGMKVGQASALTNPFVIGSDTSTAQSWICKFATMTLKTAWVSSSARFDIVDNNYANITTQPVGVEISASPTTTDITLRAYALYGNPEILNRIYISYSAVGTFPMTVDLYYVSGNTGYSSIGIKPLWQVHRNTNSSIGFITTNTNLSALPTDRTNVRLTNLANYEVLTRAGYDGDGNKIVDTYAKKAEISNPNLLVNPDFSINQRGQPGYTGTGYGVDRWKGYQLNAMVCTPRNGGGVTLSAPTEVTSTGGIYFQPFEATQLPKLAGRTVTVSFKVSANRGTSKIYVRTSANKTNAGDTPTINSGVAGVVSKTVTLPSPLTSLEIIFRKGEGTLDVDIDWVKLEIGSTATEFIPPLIEEELLKCQALETDPVQLLRSNSGAFTGLAAGQPIKKIVFNPNVSIEKMTDYLSGLTYDEAIKYDETAPEVQCVCKLVSIDWFNNSIAVYAINFNAFSSMMGTSGYAIGVVDTSVGGFVVKQTVFATEYSEANLQLVTAMADKNYTVQYTHPGWNDTKDYVLNTSTNHTIVSVYDNKVSAFIGRDSRFFDVIEMLDDNTIATSGGSYVLTLSGESSVTALEARNAINAFNNNQIVICRMPGFLTATLISVVTADASALGNTIMTFLVDTGENIIKFTLDIPTDAADSDELTFVQTEFGGADKYMCPFLGTGITPTITYADNIATMTLPKTIVIDNNTYNFKYFTIPLMLRLYSGGQEKGRTVFPQFDSRFYFADGSVVTDAGVTAIARTVASATGTESDQKTFRATITILQNDADYLVVTVKIFNPYTTQYTLTDETVDDKVQINPTFIKGWF